MTDFDLVIENTRVCTEEGLIEADIGIRDGVVASLSQSPLTAGKRLDCRGKIVLPGLIDMHSHMRDPGYTYKEDFETGSRAAAAGGVTMFVDMPNVNPPTDSLRRFLEKKRNAGRKSIIDFNHFVFPTVREVSKVAWAGAAGFKVFMVRGAYPHDPRICVEDPAKLFSIFEAVRKTGLPCLVHPSNMSLFEMFYEKHRKERPAEEKYISFGRAYIEELVYGTPVATLVMLAKRTGVRLHIVHTHSEMEIETVRKAKEEGCSVTAEVDPKYFVITMEELKRLGPLVLPGGLLSEQRTTNIWNALKSGVIDVLGTDHAPHTRDEVVKGMRKDPWEAPFGCPQLDHYLPVFLTEVNRGRLNLNQLAKIASGNPARIIGVYPRKGTIQIGSDADLVIVDMKKERVLSSEGVYTKVGWTPYEGRRVKGVPVMTIRRGEIIMQDGDVIGKRGTGKFIRPEASSIVKPSYRGSGGA